MMKSMGNMIMLTCTVGDIEFNSVFDEGFYDKTAMTYEPHIHTQYEVHIVCEGKYMIENIDGSVSKVAEPGMVILVLPHYYHSVRNESGGMIAKYAVRFEIKKLKSAEKRIKLYDSMHEMLQKLMEDGIVTFKMPEALEIFEDIHKFNGKEDPESEIMQEAYYKLFMSKLALLFINGDSYSIANKAGKKDYDETVMRKEIIVNFLSENYSNPQLNAEMLAQHLNLSPRQMSRFIFKTYGLSFHQFLTKIRLNMAKKLLLRTRMPIREIALMVGYDSPSGLYVSFKKYFNTTPNEFRANNSEKYMNSWNKEQ